MPRTTAQLKKLLKSTYDLFVPRLNEEEVHTLDEIYRLECQRLQGECPSAKKEELAMEEVQQTLYAWVEGGLTPVRVAVRVSEGIPLSEIDEAIQRVDWFSWITDVIATKDPGPYQMGGQWGRARNKKIRTIPANSIPFEYILTEAHAVVFVFRKSISKLTQKKVDRARKAGLWVETIDLSKRSKAKRKLNDRLPNDSE